MGFILPGCSSGTFGGTHRVAIAPRTLPDHSTQTQHAARTETKLLPLWTQACCHGMVSNGKAAQPFVLAGLNTS